MAVTTSPSRPSRRAAGGWVWLAASGLVAMLVLLPVAALVAVAAGGSDSWAPLVGSVLPSALPTTALLLAGVAIVTIAIGTGTAWLTAAHEFPGRRILDWALLLPLAVPTYVVAFAYLDLLHPIGPVQTAIRAVFGIHSPRDFRLPDIRSLPGAILLFGFVLYPYVYLSVRALFLMQAATWLEAAQTLGAGRGRLFRRIALPLARPAIAAGAALALMEALNDVGASEFLGIRTLTVSIFATWVNRSDVAGAAGMALALLALVLALVAAERWARRDRRFAVAGGRSNPPARRSLTGAAGMAATAICALPVLVGFALPFVHLLVAAADRVGFAGIPAEIVGETANTVALSGAGTALALAAGLVVAAASRFDGGRLAAFFARAAGIGYALPGTVLALGVLIPAAALDNALDHAARAVSGASAGLLLIGSGAALVYAYAVRFLTISAGGIEAGYARLPRALDQSARTLGHGPASILRRIHWPLLRPAIGAAAILVFIDCMKELPATLLLRPLDFETLSTHLYGEAARGTHESGAVAALLIVLAGLVPVILLARLGRSPLAVRAP